MAKTTKEIIEEPLEKKLWKAADKLRKNMGIKNEGNDSGFQETSKSIVRKMETNILPKENLS